MTTISKQAPTCPECGQPADRHTELIPVERRIVAHEAGVLTIQGLISEKCYELPEGQELLCPNGHAFRIPDDLDVTYV
ncbi:MAG: hypothetical protein AABM42_12025 [Actinomycetota bacterium]